MPDTAFVQNAVDTGVVLPPGTYMISAPITVGQYQRLQGSGGQTYILPAAPGFPLVRLAGQSSPTVRDVHLGKHDWPVVATAAILAQGGVDRILIENVWADGLFDMAAIASFDCHSSSIRHSTFWNYLNAKFTAIFDHSSDWSLFQAEYHQQAAATPSAAIWITNGSGAIRFFGGNISYKTGSGAPGWLDDAGRAAQLYGTTLYQEP